MSVQCCNNSTDQAMVISNAGVGILLARETPLLFNLTHLYRSYYKSTSKPDIWRVACEAFLVSPVVHAIITLLKKEVNITLIHKKCRHGHEVYLHSGFVSLALVDLHLITPASQSEVDHEVREAVSRQYKIYYSTERRLIVPLADLPRINDAYLYAENARKIVEMARYGQITFGGRAAPLVAVEPHPWLFQITAAAPHGLLHSGSQDSLLIKDITATVNGALNILYTSLDAVLAKKSVMTSQCKQADELMMKIAPLPQLAKRPEYPWSPTVIRNFDNLLRDD